MPSWNIHAALTEQLLVSNEAAALGIQDTNAFLFGNLVPDIYVGYMVSDASHTLRYIDTHFADSTHIPVPRAQEFWDTYVEPLAHSGGANDLTKGVWAHLLADKTYNKRVRAYNAEHHIQNGEQTRIKKQHDFDLFGHSLAPSQRLVVTKSLLADAANFAQYAIDPDDVYAASRAFSSYLERMKKAPKETTYQLLSQAFIQETFDEIVKMVTHKLANYQARVTNTQAAPKIERPVYPIGPPPGILLTNDPQAAAAYKTQH